MRILALVLFLLLIFTCISFFEPRVVEAHLAPKYIVLCQLLVPLYAFGLLLVCFILANVSQRRKYQIRALEQKIADIEEGGYDLISTTEDTHNLGKRLDQLNTTCRELVDVLQSLPAEHGDDRPLQSAAE